MRSKRVHATAVPLVCLEITYPKLVVAVIAVELSGPGRSSQAYYWVNDLREKQ